MSELEQAAREFLIKQYGHDGDYTTDLPDFAREQVQAEREKIAGELGSLFNGCFLGDVGEDILVMYIDRLRRRENDDEK